MHLVRMRNQYQRITRNARLANYVIINYRAAHAHYTYVHTTPSWPAPDNLHKRVALFSCGGSGKSHESNVALA